MSPTPPSVDRSPRDRPWIGRAALAFVLLTLVALVVVPLLVQRRVNSLRAEITASEPARTLVTRLQFNLVREMGALSELQISGDRSSVGVYTAAREAERRTFAELAPLVSRLGPEVRERFAAVRTRAERWHAQVAEDRLLRGGAAGAVPEEIPRERSLLEEVLRETAALDAAILRRTARSREQIVAAEESGLRLTLFLAVLALLSGGVVAALEVRVRRFARQAERRRWEAEVALAEAARANEARARLLRGITHDVKNPLGAAKGYAGLLAMGIKAPLHPEQAPLVEGVQRSVDGALAIIGDLLDIARADSGGLAVKRVPADLAAVAREAVEDHRAAAESAGHALEIASPSGPVPVQTDPARTRQVLGNLLSNAIKYTPAPGRITVRTARVEDDDAPRSGRWAAVRVSDTGPGIRPELREAIFDEFTRLDEGAAMKGHGLGLAISRRIARLLGGDLTLEDAPGPGATFVLWLPCRDDAPVSPPSSLDEAPL